MIPYVRTPKDKGPRKIIRQIGSSLLIILFGIIAGRFLYYNIPQNYSSFNWSQVEDVEVSGLSDGVDIEIYPVTHYITGKKFQIAYVNNMKNSYLEFGSEWTAQKWVYGKWVTLQDTRAWTSEMRVVPPHQARVDTENTFFGNGIYRITKRLEHPKFTVRFIIVKNVQRRQ